jgi:hypothetical protein
MDATAQIILVVVIAIAISAGYIWLQNKDAKTDGLSDELESRQTDTDENNQDSDT